MNHISRFSARLLSVLILLAAVSCCGSALAWADEAPELSSARPDDSGRSEVVLEDVKIQEQAQSRGFLQPKTTQTNTETTMNREAIKTLGGPAQTSPYKVMSMLPSVLVETTDPFGLTVDQNFLRVRGQLGYTFSGLSSTVEGTPSTVNVGQASIGNLYDLDNVAAINFFRGPLPPYLGLGFGDTAGSLDLSLLRPSDQPGATFKQSFGSFDFRRTFARLDSGTLPTGTKMFGSFSYTGADKWRGEGEQRRGNGEIGIVHKFSDRLKLEVYGVYNEFRLNEYRSLSYAQASNLNSFNRFDFNPRLLGNAAQDVNFFGFNKQTFTEYNGIAALEWKPTDKSRLIIKPYYVGDHGFRQFGSANTLGAPGVVRFDITQSQYGLVTQYEHTIWDTDFVIGNWFQGIQTIPPGFSQKAFRISPTGDLQFAGWATLAKVEHRRFYSPYVSVGRRFDRLYIQTGVRYVRAEVPGVIGYNAAGVPNVDYQQAFNFNPSVNSATSVSRVSDDAFLPYFGATYSIDETKHLRFAYGRNFAYPFQGPLYSSFTGNLARFQAAGVTLQNLWDRLRLEVADNFDLGFRYTTHEWYIAPTLFYGIYHDKQVAVFDPVVNLTYQQPASRATSYGAEIEVGVTPIPNLTIFAGGSFNRFTFDDNIRTATATVVAVKGKQIPDVPYVTGKAGLTYQFMGFSLSPMARILGHRYGEVRNTQRVPSYAVMDLYINYEKELKRPSPWLPKQIFAGLSLLNLFDKRYVAIITADERNGDATPTYFPGASFTVAGTMGAKF
ncbi:MAG: TonB-dependent receptor [Nitrospira sp.]|nr:TonB-dependent receptor [Nitrospira sp.]